MGVQIDFLQCDVRQQLTSRSTRLTADVVIMNPPFGTRRKGADMEFLQAAFQLSCGTIYSLHKSSTRQHIQKVILQVLYPHAYRPSATNALSVMFCISKIQ